MNKDNPVFHLNLLLKVLSGQYFIIKQNRNGREKSGLQLWSHVIEAVRFLFMISNWVVTSLKLVSLVLLFLPLISQNLNNLKFFLNIGAGAIDLWLGHLPCKKPGLIPSIPQTARTDFWAQTEWPKHHQVWPKK